MVGLWKGTIMGQGGCAILCPFRCRQKERQEKLSIRIDLAAAEIIDDFEASHGYCLMSPCITCAISRRY
jgi:hypothetical protein